MNEIKAREKARNLIEDRLKTLDDLSKIVNKSVPTLRKIRNGDEGVSLNTIFDIINKLK